MTADDLRELCNEKCVEGVFVRKDFDGICVCSIIEEFLEENVNAVLEAEEKIYERTGREDVDFIMRASQGRPLYEVCPRGAEKIYARRT